VGSTEAPADPPRGDRASRVRGPLDRWPNGWGFDYFYGFLGGGASGAQRPAARRSATCHSSRKSRANASFPESRCRAELRERDVPVSGCLCKLLADMGDAHAVEVAA
jgi:hypothetical protein